MRDCVRFVKRFVSEEDAPTLVEYGLMLGVIATTVAAAALMFGKGVSSLTSIEKAGVTTPTPTGVPVVEVPDSTEQPMDN